MGRQESGTILSNLALSGNGVFVFCSSVVDEVSNVFIIEWQTIMAEYHAVC